MTSTPRPGSAPALAQVSPGDHRRSLRGRAGRAVRRPVGVPAGGRPGAGRRRRRLPAGSGVPGLVAPRRELGAAVRARRDLLALPGVGLSSQCAQKKSPFLFAFSPAWAAMASVLPVCRGAAGPVPAAGAVRRRSRRWGCGARPSCSAPRVRGAGCIGTPPAVLNAVADALQLPVTPEQVWRLAAAAS
ncbi:MAG: hypothetical protein AVDCRST_MAG48-351 [uncultured Friedmanniella sp.]|uniref:Uncharacterized protein n=1 Tax=uncultured Friedmanniella sp. TaxID=335381 RepID=A0A6J4JVK7_9ACTN|nr:MAG: hypothetical protein AVDCRST_MAG48-351 [uncultured Friedmanniella sp.]